MRFIPIESVQPGMIVGRDIISSKNAKMVTKGSILTKEYIDYLQSHGYIGVYVSDLISEDIDIPDPVSQKVFREGVEAVAEANVGHILNVSTEIVREISSQKDVHVDLIDLRSFDDYTYHHSVNVAVYSVAVGTKMGLSDTNIAYLSQAAICHDLGKMKIPEEILKKPARLTDKEYDIVKNHSKWSYDILNQNPEVSAVVKQAVLLHHENENGTGYPMKKKGKDLSLIAKIIHAVDVYDALTSKRPYKDAHAPVSAFEYLKSGCDILFDKNVVEAMTQVIPAYPPGTDVRLTGDKMAVVVRHSADAMRPVVKTIEDMKIIDLSAPANKDIEIIDSGFMVTEYSSDVELLNERRNKFGGRADVMVIDDNVLSLMEVKSILEADYQVTTVRSGFDALEKIRKSGVPDLIIVETKMPMMDGPSFVKAYKKMGVGNAPIIFLTASSSREIVEKCIEVGAADYIVKPTSPVYLKERVAYALRETLDI